MPRPLPTLLAACLAATALLAPGAATADAPVSPVTPKIIGMSAPSGLWNQRLSEVGSCGVEARRIFADLTSNGRSQSTLIGQAVSAGMVVVVSYKVPSVSTLKAGGYDSWIAATRTYLNGLGVQVTATFWHEPHGDMSATDFRAGSEKFLAMKAPNVAVGPLLNGWLLDRQTSTFASYTSPALLDAWDFVGIDSYQSGTQSNPGKPAGRAVPLLAKWLDDQGFPDKRIIIGEWNGADAAAISEAGETFLSTPEVWVSLAWNSAASRFGTFTGSEITAFQNIKADPRAANDCR